VAAALSRVPGHEPQPVGKRFHATSVRGRYLDLSAKTASTAAATQGRGEPASLFHLAPGWWERGPASDERPLLAFDERELPSEYAPAARLVQQLAGAGRPDVLHAPLPRRAARSDEAADLFMAGIDALRAAESVSSLNTSTICLARWWLRRSPQWT
jgi:hypothetical protein